MDSNSSIFIAGHKGLVGSALIRQLQAQGYNNIITTHTDLRSQMNVSEFFHYEKPEYVFLAAAKVGGIVFNKAFPADFIRDNLLIQTNVIDAARAYGTKKLMFLGTACIYPKMAPVPIKEEYLMTGPLEESNSAYAIAKIAGIQFINSFRKEYGRKWISLMPTNLYGPRDNFELQGSHVLPAFVRRFVEAKESGQERVVLWGTGSPMREFLHTDDLASAVVLAGQKYDSVQHLNIGSGEDLTIKELAELVADLAGFKGEIAWDSSKPDGTPRKVLDIGRIKSLGWFPTIDLNNGIASTIEWYIDATAKGVSRR